MQVIIRTYKPTDKEDIISIFYSNCPKYFDKNDFHDLIYFLENYADTNFKVVTADKIVVGCGGYYIKHESQIFGIAWTMFKRFSLGTSLFLTISKNFFAHILEQIKKENLNYDIVINTTQLLENTFKKHGFITEKIITNGFGAGLNHYMMRKRLEA